MVYMRPHELDIKLYRNGAPSFPATVTRINPAGSIAKVTTRTNDGQEVLVDLSLDDYQRLSLTEGSERVHLSEEHPRVFARVRNLSAKGGPRDDRWRSCRDGASFQSIENVCTERDAAPDETLTQIRDSLRGLKFGSVNIIVQDGVVIQIDRTEKRRLRGNRNNA